MSIDYINKPFFKLKAAPDFAAIVEDLLMPGETVEASFKSMRDGVVFTDRRVIAVNVQGITGSKKAFTSLPYKNVVAFSVETSGTFDLDSELELHFSAVGRVKFDFKGAVDIKAISNLISAHIFSTHVSEGSAL